MDNNITTQQPQALAVQPANLMAALCRAASDQSTDIDKMERLFAMHQKLEAAQAESQFNDALSACQREMTTITADMSNSQTRSKYASYAKLDRVVRPIYTAHGISISFDTADSPKPEHVRVVAYVSKSGHTRKYQIDMPADGKGAKGGDVMTKTHAAAAAIAYGSRYLLKSIFNLAVGEADTDGNDPRGISEKQYADFEAAIDAVDSKESADNLWKSIAAACTKAGDVTSYENLKRIMAAKYKGLK